MGKTQHLIPNTFKKKNLIRHNLLAFLVLITIAGLLIIFTNMQSFGIYSYNSEVLAQNRINSAQISPLPSPKSYPLPPQLDQWQDQTNSGDYFSQVATTEVGYLIWSKFPINIYVEKPKNLNLQQAEAWVNQVLQAVEEWNAYLPLKIVQQSEVADISILRKVPPLQIQPGNKILRARSALTTYKLYINQTNNSKNLYQRFTILLNPSQINEYLLAAARHELGHALGIWGHSPMQSDALYFSQTRNPPGISARDVNTLKRVYEQPTSLGWSF